MYDQDGTPVALIAEEISGIGNEIQRQLLRTRRSFTSTVLSADGEAGAGSSSVAGSTVWRCLSLELLLGGTGLAAVVGV